MLGWESKDYRLKELSKKTMVFISTGLESTISGSFSLNGMIDFQGGSVFFGWLRRTVWILCVNVKVENPAYHLPRMRANSYLGSGDALDDSTCRWDLEGPFHYVDPVGINNQLFTSACLVALPDLGPTNTHTFRQAHPHVHVKAVAILGP